jgi:hypothetical protein
MYCSFCDELVLAVPPRSGLVGVASRLACGVPVGSTNPFAQAPARGAPSPAGCRTRCMARMQGLNRFGFGCLTAPAHNANQLSQQKSCKQIERDA